MASTLSATGPARTIKMTADGYLVFLPPNSIQARFVMLEEQSDTFYDVDTQTPLLGNPTAWEAHGISESALAGEDKGLAILVPRRLDQHSKEELQTYGYNPDFETGALVALEERAKLTGPPNLASARQQRRGRTVGRVNVKPLTAAYMSWNLLRDKKGPVLTEELQTGLMGRLWAHRDPRPGGCVITADISDKMSREWRTDPSALSSELDHMFAVGKELAKSNTEWLVQDTLRLFKPGDGVEI